MYLFTVALELDNRIVEEFLKEALIMKKFNHPNVLNMIGISAHEEKPCVILPLMSNGDLKKYLSSKKSVCFEIAFEKYTIL